MQLVNIFGCVAVGISEIYAGTMPIVYQDIVIEEEDSVRMVD